VEAALALLGVTVVLVAVLWCVGLLASQLALGEAARAAARSAARGDSAAAVETEAHHLVPEAVVTVSSSAAHVVVDVRREVRPPGLLAGLGAVVISARAVAASEAAP
jgi:hypothetical protein